MGSVCEAPRETPQPQTGCSWAAGAGVRGTLRAQRSGAVIQGKSVALPVLKVAFVPGIPGEGAPLGTAVTPNRGMMARGQRWCSLPLDSPPPLQLVVSHPLSAVGPALWNGKMLLLVPCHWPPAQRGGTGSCGAAVSPGQDGAHLLGTGHG